MGILCNMCQIWYSGPVYPQWYDLFVQVVPPPPTQPRPLYLSQSPGSLPIHNCQPSSDQISVCETDYSFGCVFPPSGVDLRPNRCLTSFLFYYLDVFFFPYRIWCCLNECTTLSIFSPLILLTFFLKRLWHFVCNFRHIFCIRTKRHSIFQIN